MHRHPFLLFILTLIVIASGRPLLADDADAAIAAKLRDALKNTMGQLSDVQAQLVTLQAAKDQADKDNADLKTQLDTANATIATLTANAAKDKSDWDAAKTDLIAQNNEKDREIATLNAAIVQWKAAYAQSDALAKATEDARQKLAAQIIELQRLVVDRETKNLQLYQTANDILVRYEKFSLGDALAAKEPFVGITRTKLQNLVQGYQQKLAQGTTPPPPSSVMITPKVQ